MVCETYFQGDSVVHRLDPRGRVVVAVVFSVLIAVSERYAVLGGGLAAGIALAVVARLPVKPLLKRLGALNGFMAMLIILLPLTTFEEPSLELFGISVSQPGLLLALAVTVKANAIVLALTAFVGTPSSTCACPTSSPTCSSSPSATSTCSTTSTTACARRCASAASARG